MRQRSFLDLELREPLRDRLRMDHLSATQCEQLRSQLRTEQQELLARVSPHFTELPLPHGEPRDLSDMATEDELRMLLRGLDLRQQRRLFELAAALVRLRDGVYGICEDSDEPIPFARLAFDPATRRTTEAQAQFEQEQAQARRVARDKDGHAY